MSAAPSSLYISFLSPPAPEQGSESGLEDGQNGSNHQKARAFSSVKITVGRGREKREGEEREVSQRSVPASRREAVKSISSTLCNLLISWFLIFHVRNETHH